MTILLQFEINRLFYSRFQRWSLGQNFLGQGHAKKSEAKDRLPEDRPSQGQGQECSRPRPRTKDTRRKRSQKKGPQTFFSGNLREKGSSREETPIFRKKSGVFTKKKKTKKIFANVPRGFCRSRK